MAKLTNDRGQATLEYILLLLIVVGAFIAMMQAFGKFNIATQLMKPLSGDFAHAYQYGHPKALGFDDGGPQQHPRANEGSDSFRIFYVQPK